MPFLPEEVFFVHFERYSCWYVLLDLLHFSFFFQWTLNFFELLSFLKNSATNFSGYFFFEEMIPVSSSMLCDVLHSV